MNSTFAQPADAVAATPRRGLRLLRDKRLWLAGFLVLTAAGPALADRLGLWPSLGRALLDADRSVHALAAVGVKAVLLHMIRPLLLGVMVALAVLQRGRRPAPRLLAAAVVGTLAAVVFLESLGPGGTLRLPRLTALGLPTLAAAAGLAGTLAIGRGGRGRRFGVAAAAAAVIASIAGGVGLARLAVVDGPSPIVMPAVTSQAKRDIVNTLRRDREYEYGTDEVATLRFNDRQVRVIAAWSASIIARRAAASVTLDDGAVDVHAAAPRPGGPGHVELAARLAMRGGDRRVDLRLERLTLGHTALPMPLVRLIEPLVLSPFLDDPSYPVMETAVVDLTVDRRAIALAYRRDTLPDDFFANLATDGAQTSVLSEAQDYTAYLIAVAERVPRGGDRLGGFLNAAFDRARRQSVAGDPVRENRAAIYALAVLLGHPEVQRLTGPLITDEQRPAYSRRVGTATVRGRNDLVRHFFVSAALALTASEGISDEAGLLKEQLDAAMGGSGFSFADLTADRAGSRFALMSVRDEASARAIQETLAESFDEDWILPDVRGLPEGLRDRDLERDFDGVNGPRYRAMTEHIERLLDGCRLLR